MEGKTAKESVVHNSGHSFRASDSQESFQKFLYELFEKNGILSSLRAHLRSHIVDVLKSAQTGTPPPSQKNFTQRLELPYQALNILIVEHLIALEFNYTLSVFISEIPLANMVFDFAKSLFDGLNNGKGANKHLRFKEPDVWAILNCLGIKCNSEFAINVFEMYKKDETCSLLLCILNYMPSCNRPMVEDVVSSVQSSQSSIRIYRNESPEPAQGRTLSPYKRDKGCKHIASCRECVRKLQKYKKRNLEKKEKGSSAMSVEDFMANVGITERRIMEEMFEDIKTVYDAEVEMYKVEEEKRLKLSLVNHAKLLKQRRDEMEGRFKEREAELFRNVNEKKKFLWGLASSLRTQHSQMSRAMCDVRRQTELLAEKEDNLRVKLLEAEESLKKRGEEMRSQISSELQSLETHLETLKNEREKINQERLELEKLKKICEKAEKIASQDNLETANSSNFDMIKNEIAILKEYLENTKMTKFLIETGTLTESEDILCESVLNNEQSEKNLVESESKRSLNQVVNDLKKQKNVNFCQENVELYREFLTATSSMTEGVDRLKEENENLKIVARQQREQIEALMRQQSELRAQIATLSLVGNTFRPRTAPASLCLRNNRAPTFGAHKGAGEELSSVCVTVQSRGYAPGERPAFLPGVEKRADSRRYLMSQWRKLRRLSPPSPKAHTSRPANKASTSRAQEPTLHEGSFDTEEQVEEPPPVIKQVAVQRQKSPQSFLREAKEKLRNKDRSRPPLSPPRRSSPSAVLKEAKLRLRKLEQQACAVEQSYRDYRRRRESDLTGKPSTSKENLTEADYQRISDAYVHSKHAMKTLQLDYDMYLSQTKLNLNDTYYKNKNTTEMPKSIFTREVAERDRPHENYIDFPMTEFRKLYGGLSDIPGVEDEVTHKDNKSTNNSNFIPSTPVNEKSEIHSEYVDTKVDKSDTIQNDTQEISNEILRDQDGGGDLKEINDDVESIPSISKNIKDIQLEVIESEDLKTSLLDKKKEFEIIKNNITKLCNLDSQLQAETNENKEIYNQKDESLKTEIESQHTDNKTSEISRDTSKKQNLLRVEINSVSEIEKSIKSAKFNVIVTSILNQADKDETNNHIAVISPKRNSDTSESSHFTENEEISIGGAKDIGDENTDNYLDDFTNIMSDATPVSDNENFWGNLS